MITFVKLSHFTSYSGFHWEYEMFGSGTEMMMAFHGFGNHSSDFRVLERSVGKKYTVFSFNLPYHGASYIDESRADKTISKEELKKLFQQFFHHHSIARFSLMGYSLGGKIALQLLELFPERINAVFLFAPDGIRNNWSNGFVTRNKIGKTIYGRMIQDPSRFLRLVKMLQSMNVLHEKLSDFLHRSMSTKEKRQQVWDVWICFRDIKPNIRNIQDLINEKSIRIHLFFGKYDRVIPPSIGKKFLQRLKDKTSLHVVDMGHVMLKDKLNEYLLVLDEK